MADDAADVEEVVEHGGCRVAVRATWGVGIGGKTWTTGALACRHLDAFAARYARLARPDAKLRVCELGAGTGVAGLFAAKRLGASVVLTDLADHLDLLETNVRRNDAGAGDVAVALLDWADPATRAPLDAGFDLVIATDAAYHPSLHAPLADTLQRACAGGARCLVGVTKSDTGPEFFGLLRRRGLEYRFAEPPEDDYSALLAVEAAPDFDARREPWDLWVR